MKRNLAAGAIKVLQFPVKVSSDVIDSWKLMSRGSERCFGLRGAYGEASEASRLRKKED